MRAALLAAGFQPAYQAALGPGTLVKVMTAWEMPYVREHIIGTMGVTDSDLVILEVVPEGMVQMRIEAVDYIEEPAPAESEEGLGVLRDAGVLV